MVTAAKLIPADVFFQIKPDLLYVYIMEIDIFVHIMEIDWCLVTQTYW